MRSAVATLLAVVLGMALALALVVGVELFSRGRLSDPRRS